jgi:hypothetical protein
VESNILCTIKRRKADGFGHIVRRNCLLKYVIEENMAAKIGVTGRRGEGRKPSLCDFKGTRRYWKSKEKALDRCVWRTPFGRIYGRGARQPSRCR